MSLIRIVEIPRAHKSTRTAFHFQTRWIVREEKVSFLDALCCTTRIENLHSEIISQILRKICKSLTCTTLGAQICMYPNSAWLCLSWFSLHALGFWITPYVYNGQPLCCLNTVGTYLLNCFTQSKFFNQASETAQWALARHALEKSILSSPTDVIVAERLLEVLLHVKDRRAVNFIAEHLLKINPGHLRAAQLVKIMAAGTKRVNNLLFVENLAKLKAWISLTSHSPSHVFDKTSLNLGMNSHIVRITLFCNSAVLLL